MKNTSKKKRIKEIMKNLNSTISKENAKSNGRNEDLIDKLTWKLEDLEDLLAKKGPTSSTK